MAGSSERRLRVAEKRVKKCLKRDKLDAKSFEIVSTRTRSDHYEFYVLYEGKQSGKNNVGSTPSAQQTTKKIQSALRGMLEEVGIKQSCRRAWEEVSFMMLPVKKGDYDNRLTGFVDREFAESLISSHFFWESLLTLNGCEGDVTDEAWEIALAREDDEIVESYRWLLRDILEQEAWDEYYVMTGAYSDTDFEYWFEGTENFTRAMFDLARGKLELDEYHEASEGEAKLTINEEMVCRCLGAKSLADVEADIAQAVLSGEISA